MAGEVRYQWPDPSACAAGWRRRTDTGLTLIELTVTLAILSILAAGVMPLSRMSYQRVKEIELRRNLRIIRTAIDDYKALADEKKIDVGAMESGYPESLEVLVQGVDIRGPNPMKHKFLRRIPRDPMTEDGKWGLRSYSDEPDSTMWGGQDVYDVYSLSDAQALDGTEYRQW